MASIGKWNTPTAAATVLSTELDGLANAGIATSAAYDNSANLDIFVDIEVYLAALSPSAGAYVSIYAAEAVDGTNYPAPSAADLRLAASQLLCTIPIGTTAATAQRVVARNVMLPPQKLKFILDNQTGVQLAANSSTVKVLAYDYNLNG